MRNPYDRRHEGRGTPETPEMGWWDFSQLSRGTDPPDFVGASLSPLSPAITFEDLDAMARSACARATREAEQRHRESLRNARRVAFDQGAKAARAELLAVLDRQYGQVARVALADGRTMLEAAWAGEKVPKRVLRGMLSRCLVLIGALIEGHHEGFPSGEPPDLSATVELPRDAVDAEVGWEAAGGAPAG